jgi:site-specific DNA-cytosine methylase
VTARRHDLPAAAAVKGSARMATVLGRAVRDEAPGDPGELRWFYRDDRLVLSRRELRHLRRQLLSNGQKRNRARPKVERAVVDALWRQVSGERGREAGARQVRRRAHRGRPAHRIRRGLVATARCGAGVAVAA